MKKVYFWKLKITQFGKIVQVRTRVEALTNLNFIFHETLIKAELNILEEKEC